MTPPLELPEKNSAWTWSVIFRIVWVIAALGSLWSLFWLAFIDITFPRLCNFVSPSSWKDGIPYWWNMLAIIFYAWELVLGYHPKNRKRVVISLLILLACIPWLTWPYVGRMSEVLLFDGFFSRLGLVWVVMITSHVGLVGNRLDFLLFQGKRDNVNK